ncbi:MAG TPA: pyridoxal phosphate-dependent aminotransferase, partial [Candidatus Eisenbacteria bacterium]|nr:pyridoxal phosphate-dependent aminotransferase [Candidatus Eisenbacteria bacterium]
MAAAESRRAADPEFVDLAVTNPTRVGLGLETPGPLIFGHDYDPDPQGLAAARSAVAACYRASGASVSAEDIVLTASTSEAYAFLFKLLADPGDEVLVPEPSYPLFEHLTVLEGVVPRPYPLVYSGGRWCVDLEAVTERISPRSRGLVLVHPNNPTGSYLHLEEIETLGRLTATHDLPLIIDEVFFEYPRAHLEFTPIRPADHCPEPLIFSLGGLSKLCAMPQAKLAWIRVSGHQSLKRSALEKLNFIADAYLSVGTAVQVALPTLLGHAKPAQSRIRARLEANGALLAQRSREVPDLRE